VLTESVRAQSLSVRASVWTAANQRIDDIAGGAMNESAVSDPRTGSKRIVVGVDGSRFGVAALRWALREGKKHGNPVQAIMAWQPETTPVGPQPPFGVAHRLPGEPPDRHADALAASVAEAMDDLDDAEPSQVLVRGWPPEVLVHASQSADLLVLGSHGRRRMLDTAVGSVLEYCIRHAYCAVVVIPARMARPGKGVTTSSDAVAASSGR
jgi:nucleotide-binding universal stress UspA family protein